LRLAAAATRHAAAHANLNPRPQPQPDPLKPKQAREVSAGLRGLSIDLVVTSPFKRCLQTSAEIVAELGVPQGCWLVDWGLSEVRWAGWLVGWLVGWSVGWLVGWICNPAIGSGGCTCGWFCCWWLVVGGWRDRLLHLCTVFETHLCKRSAPTNLPPHPPNPPPPQICDPRVLLHGRPDCEHMAKGRPIEAWMWGGATVQEAIGMFTESCAWVGAGAVGVVVGPWGVAVWRTSQGVAPVTRLHPQIDPGAPCEQAPTHNAAPSSTCSRNPPTPRPPYPPRPHHHHHHHHHRYRAAALPLRIPHPPPRLPAARIP